MGSQETEDERSLHTLTHPVSARDGLLVRNVKLEVVAGPARGQQWAGGQGRCVIGSHPRCDLILDDPTVSRFHCEIHVDARRARVRDSGSRNGTIVDGVEVGDAFLRDRSQLQLGRSTVAVIYGHGASRVPMSERSQFGRLHGASSCLRAVFALLERASATDVTVLLEGETGTGKSVAARSVHDESRRAAGPMVILDCAAVPPNLLESELFGHERGAFTGAESSRGGVFEEADGGTLFLDEIGELPLELQSKLLGVLETREVRRVGANRSRSVDVRIIAATNRDLRAEVNAGRFRADLYYRLGVVTVTMPPLRSRPDDLGALAEHLLTSIGADAERIESLLTEELLSQLRSASWPGNVRELRNYLELCLVFDEVLPIDGGIVSPGNNWAEIDLGQSLAEARSLAMSRFEKAYLQAMLDKHELRVSAAALDAGVDRTHFYRLLRRHRLKIER